MIDFEPTEDQRLMRDSVAQFAKSTLLPRAREFEKLRGVPDDVRKLAHEMGLGLVALPEDVGGAGLGLTTAVLLEEELGAADAAAAFGLPGPGAFGLALAELGSKEQATAELAAFAAPDAFGRYGAVAWSEAKPNKERAGFTTVAKPDGDGFVLTGKKAFVVNAHLADRFVVFAQVDEAAGWRGIGAFLVKKDAAGVKPGARHTTLGLDAADFGDLELEGVKVDAAARLAGGGDFTQAALRFFAKHALVVGARGVGLARYAYEIAREYCDTRKAFGKPIGHFQAVAFNLADRHMDVESSRWLLHRAASAWDQGLKETYALRATAQAVAFALEATMRTADDGVSLHGGAGFIRDLVAEKLSRDAKQLALCCSTAEQLDQLATALELGVPLDPALVLPTPETQSIFT
ncbi:MAG TPA: acyl-CoA dehydrogenase family protein [Minicystis sp.]|nr:acyl-CoA dehydrogenase family protein [Minicystis sp.]